MSKLQTIDGDRVTNFDRVSIKNLQDPSAMVAYMTSFEDGETGEEIIYGACSKRALVGYLDSEFQQEVDDKQIQKVLIIPGDNAELNWE